MLQTLLMSILTLSLVFGAYGIQFSITTFLNNWQFLEEKNWSHVKVTENCSSGDNVTVRVEIPLTLHFNFTNDEMNIFFANDKKEILQTSLKKNIRGTFFSVPYKMEKTMEGPQVKQNISGNYSALEVNFPKAWLPKKCNKISASIQSEGQVYNYYGIRNSDISIQDLMVTEEYENYKCDS